MISILTRLIFEINYLLLSKILYYLMIVRNNLLKNIKRGMDVKIIDKFLFMFFTIKAFKNLIQITAIFRQIFDFAFIFTCERFKKADVRVIAAKRHPYMSYSLLHLLFRK